VVASEGEGYADTYVAGFEGEKAVYDLDLQILSDGSCLNPGHPRLRIYTDKSFYEDYTTPALWLSVLSIAVGTSLRVFFFLTNYEGRSAAITSITASETISPYFSVGPEAAAKAGNYRFAIVRAGVCLVFELAGHASPGVL
jgi:hypothetical protein